MGFSATILYTTTLIVEMSAQLDLVRMSLLSASRIYEIKNDYNLR